MQQFCLPSASRTIVALKSFWENSYLNESCLLSEMVLDALGESLRKTLSKVTKAGFIDKKLVLELVKDLQKSLMQADVNVKLVLDISNKIKERALEEKPPAGITAREHLVNILYEELAIFLGGKAEELEIKKKGYTFLLVGLFGNGKTTTAAKLANYFKKKGEKVLIVGTDTWRPAALEQLKQLASQINVDVLGDTKAKKPEDVIKKFKPKFKEYDVVLVDSAGRDALNGELVEELRAINKALKPDETLLVLGADNGQTAQKQAELFKEEVNITGVVITKLEGTAKGGGALAACSVTGAPVRFIGVGEKVNDLELFEPEGFVGRLLGMGDLKALLEKAREAISEEDAADLNKRLMKGEFTLDDLYEQMKAMKKMGSLSKIMKLVPGMGGMNIPKEALQGQETKMDIWKVAMDSMTKEEKRNPDLLNSSRLDRISKGSGTTVSDVRGLLKQYKQAKKMMKMMKGGSGSEADMQKMMQKMQGKKMRLK